MNMHLAKIAFRNKGSSSVIEFCFGFLIFSFRSASYICHLTMFLIVRECVRCIALLQNSLQILLRCVEIVNSDSEDQDDYFTWKVEEGVKCASYLRRVYEEVCQKQKTPFFL